MMSKTRFYNYLVITALGAANMLSLSALAKTALLPVATKQDIHNVRYISPDGKKVYFQRGNGELLLSSNFKSFPVLQNPPQTTYQITSSPADRYLIITTILPGHSIFAAAALPLAFMASGTTQTYPLPPGVNPRLHLHDQWMSSFDPTDQTIHFTHLENRISKFNIKLHNHRYPSFRPEVVMLNEDEIIYTDLNEQGLLGILKLNRSHKKTSLLWKAESPSQTIELCWDQNQLFIGERQHLTSKIYSKILTATKDNLSKTDPAFITIYQSKLLDLGHLICDLPVDEVLFIKNTSQNGRTSYEGAVVAKKPVAIQETAPPAPTNMGGFQIPGGGGPPSFIGAPQMAGPPAPGDPHYAPPLPAGPDPITPGKDYWQIYQDTPQENVHLVTDVEDAMHIINFGKRPLLFWQNQYLSLGQKINPQLEEQTTL